MAKDRFVAAKPRNTDELADLPRCPDLVVAASQKGITQVVHFTTVRGVIGILATNAIKSRKRLPKEQYLEHVYRPNVRVRKDSAWLDYVNLSISRVNDWMFGASARWHALKKNPWVALALDPELLGDPGVVFATTNNIYPSCRREEGVEGFQALFADSVLGRYEQNHTRVGLQPNWPTDRQAEVLYPGEVPCRYLHRIDVQRPDTLDTIHGVLGGLGREIALCHAPEVFE